MRLCQIICDLCFHASSLTCLHTFWHAFHPSHSHSPSHTLTLTLTHQPDNYEAQLVESHKAKAGYTPARIELEFLQVAKDLPCYGMCLFAAQVSN